MIRVCMEVRCPSPAVYRGRCREHSRSRERTTHPNKSFYNSARWKYARQRQLFDFPLCEVCGLVATDVDHRVPLERGGAPFAPANLSSLCHPHHSEKTRREQAWPRTQS
jgi:5-methylcytosine-specific restriction enzyme A